MTGLESVPGGLRLSHPDRLWGVTPASLYLGLCATENGEPIESAIQPACRAETLSCNVNRDRALVADAIDTILSDSGLVRTGSLTDVGIAIAGYEDPREALRTVLPVRLPKLVPFLREFGTRGGDPVTRGDLMSLVRDDCDGEVVIPLLDSLGFADVTPDGAVPHLEQVEKALTAVESTSTSDHESSRLRMVLSARTDLPMKAIQRVVSEAESDTGDTPVNPRDPGYQEPRIDLITLANSAPTVTTTDSISEFVDAARETAAGQKRNLTDALSGSPIKRSDDLTEDLNDHLRKQFERIGVNPDAPVPRNSGSVHIKADSTLDATVALIEGVSGTLGCIPPSVPRAFAGIAEYDLFRILSGSELCNPTTGPDGVIHLDQLAVGQDRQQNRRADSLQDHVVDALTTTDQHRSALAGTSLESITDQRSAVVSAVYDELPNGAVEPTTFAFTLPDPTGLGEKVMSDYTGDCEALVRERARLDDWHRRQQSSDAARFTELTDRILNRGVRHDLDHQVLRIMTPYDDDTLGEFASTFRNLLDKGYEIRLLTRHTRERWQWERLRDNLLGELEGNRDQVTLRTYSRYKNFGRVDFEAGDTDRSDFGVHAKLQTVGDANDGAALLGSANFMENSYDWNPECGVYTEQSRFIAAAIDFFDVVWELSAADEVSLERLQEIPDRSLYPSYYS